MGRNKPKSYDPESAIIDAELLVKYRMVSRAIESLELAIANAPSHIGLREKLREILIDAGRREQAAQQCLALASLHIHNADNERANEMLLDARRLDPRVSVTGQLHSIRQPEASTASSPATSRPHKVLSGNLADISIFDIVQILENARLTGALHIVSTAAGGEVHFQDGQIVGAKAGPDLGTDALGKLMGASEGTFDFEKVARDFDRSIQATSNTALILDMLRAKDEEEHGLGALDSL